MGFKDQTGVKTFEDNLANNLNSSSGYARVINIQTGRKQNYDGEGRIKIR